MVKVRFTLHAKRQLTERRLTKKQALLVIEKYDSVKYQIDGRSRFVKKILKNSKWYALVVIAEKTLKNITIVTVFLSSKVKKYL